MVIIGCLAVQPASVCLDCHVLMHELSLFGVDDFPHVELEFVCVYELVGGVLSVVRLGSVYHLAAYDDII